MHPDYSEAGDWTFPVDTSNPAYGNKLIINLAVVWRNRVVKIGTDESYTLSFTTSDDGVSLITNYQFLLFAVLNCMHN